MEPINRKTFLRSAILGTSAVIIGSSATSKDMLQDKPAPLKLEIVKEFVGVSHGQFDRVKEMLENNHLLLHASHDWGGGDFESGIEAAGHVGNREIAAYLLEKGARYNIYLACMLGHLETVRQALTAAPGLLNSKGPHGFTMLHHAQRGEGQAIQVVEYLQSLGAKETKVDFYARA